MTGDFLPPVTTALLMRVIAEPLPLLLTVALGHGQHNQGTHKRRESNGSMSSNLPICLSARLRRRYAAGRCIRPRCATGLEERA